MAIHVFGEPIEMLPEGGRLPAFRNSKPDIEMRVPTGRYACQHIFGSKIRMGQS